MKSNKKEMFVPTLKAGRKMWEELGTFNMGICDDELIRIAGVELEHSMTYMIICQDMSVHFVPVVSTTKHRKQMSQLKHFAKEIAIFITTMLDEGTFVCDGDEDEEAVFKEFAEPPVFTTDKNKEDLPELVMTTSLEGNLILPPICDIE